MGVNQKIAPEENSPPVRVRFWVRLVLGLGDNFPRGQLSKNRIFTIFVSFKLWTIVRLSYSNGSCCFISMLLHIFCFSLFLCFWIDKVALVLSFLIYTDPLLSTNQSHILERCLIKKLSISVDFFVIVEKNEYYLRKYLGHSCNLKTRGSQDYKVQIKCSQYWQASYSTKLKIMNTNGTKLVRIMLETWNLVLKHTYMYQGPRLILVPRPT